MPDDIHPPGDRDYQRRPVTVMVSAEGLAARLDQLPTRKQMWRAARLGTLTRAAIVIAWIEIAHRVCL